MSFFPSQPPYYPIVKALDLKSDWLQEVEKDNRRQESDDSDDNPEFIQPRCLHYKHFVNPYQKEVPEYPDDIAVFEPIEKGKFFDVISMLCTNGRDFLVRNNGDRVLVEALRGKYLLICCFLLPTPIESSPALACLDIIPAYSQLCVERPNEFEMVIVAKMRRDWIQDESAFNHFFSAFACLAIPFWGMATLIVDPKQIVLQPHNHHFFQNYGALSFPFTVERLDFLNQEDHEIRSRLHNGNNIPSLDELLCLDSSDFLRNSLDENELINVSDLNNKLVGIYLSTGGEFLSTLDFFHKKCKAKGLEFEVVLVYMPYLADTRWVQNRVNKALAKFKVSWWVLPFKDYVSRRLSRFCLEYIHDQVIILGPNSTFFETLGREVMSHYGIASYPFTRERIVDLKLAKLRSLTLESVLTMSTEHNYVVTKDGVRVPVSELLGRNIIIYLDFLRGCEDNKLYAQLIRWYPELKAKDPNFEVVFVGFDDTDDDYSDSEVDERFYTMPWPVVPFPTDHSEYTIEQLILEWEDTFKGLIAFDKDGRIRSRRAHLYLQEHGLDAFPLCDHLRQELSSDFHDLNTCY